MRIELKDLLDVYTAVENHTREVLLKSICALLTDPFSGPFTLSLEHCVSINKPFGRACDGFSNVVLLRSENEGAERFTVHSFGVNDAGEFFVLASNSFGEDAHMFMGYDMSVGELMRISHLLSDVAKDIDLNLLEMTPEHEIVRVD